MFFQQNIRTQKSLFKNGMKKSGKQTGKLFRNKKDFQQCGTL